MIDITHKHTTLRIATAQAIVKVGSKKTINALENNKVPKGNVFEMAKTAGLFAVKNTALVIPDCHPLPIEYTDVKYEIDNLNIKINITVKAIYRTGVEVEAMHGASVIALTMYDMLKPIDKNISINEIKLLNKIGGKSDFKDEYRNDITAVVVVCSDSIFKGTKEDKAGKIIISKLEKSDVQIKDYIIIPDEINDIRDIINKNTKENIDLIIFTGGTGLSPRDITPEAILPVLDKEIPGIVEAARSYGQDRTPYSMLSRSVAGTIGNTLVIALPGSTNGAKESMDAIFPAVLHIFRILKGARHD
jgi:molybdenum cofactor biosynthesis protein MoaC